MTYNIYNAVKNKIYPLTLVCCIFFYGFNIFSSAETNVQEPFAKPSLNVLRDVTFQDETNTLNLTLENPVESTSFNLSAPPRLVIDLVNSIYEPVYKTIETDSVLVKRIRISQFNKKIVRVVIDFKNKNTKYEITSRNNKLHINLTEKGSVTETEPEKAELIREHAKISEESNLLESGIKAETNQNWKEGVDIYNRYLESHPNDIKILKRKSDIEFKLGDYDSGIKSLEKISEISPDDRTYYQISQAYSISDQPEKALEAMKQAVRLAPDNREYRESEASLANWVAEYETAKDAYKALLKLSPEDKSTLFKLANVLNWTGDTDEAVNYYKKYLKYEPSNPGALLNLAKAESFRGNYDASIHDLNKYAEVKEKDENYAKEMSRALIFSGRPEKGLNLLSPELDKDPDNYDLNVLKTFGLLNSRQFRETRVSLNRTLQLEPDNSYNRNFRRFIETPLKSYVQLNSNVYFDSDNIVITHQDLGFRQVLNPETSLKYILLTDQLTADSNSPFARKSGGDYIYHFTGMFGIDHYFNPDFNVTALAGVAATSEDFTPNYDITLNYRPAETLKISFQGQLDYYLVSPLSVEENVRRYLNKISIQFQPSTGYYVYGWASMNFYSDNNRQWELLLNPRKELLRLEHFNLDIGASGYWFGFSDDLNNGYYDPSSYQRYLAHGYGYIKIDDDNGIALNGGIGIQEDNMSNDFSFSANASAEAFIGIYRNWFFTLGGSYYNTRLPSGAFDAYSLQLGITNRF